MKLEVFKGAAKRALNLTGLKIQKYSPEILLGVGTIGVISATVLACKQTLKANDILEQHKEKREVIEQVANDKEFCARENYTPEDKKKDIGKLYIQTGIQLAKNYLVPAALMGSSIACIFTGFGIVKSRNASLLAAYNAAQQAYSAYRERVKTAIGEEKENDIFAGLTDKKIDHIELDEEGNTKVEKDKKKKAFEKDDPKQYSKWARFFDEMSDGWDGLRGNHDLIKDYLETKNNTWQFELHRRGVVFFNDICRDFDWPICEDGWKFGWVDDGKTTIDFGIYAGNKSSVRFVNGYTNAVLLDFNPTYIFDKFEKYQNL